MRRLALAALAAAGIMATAMPAFAVTVETQFSPEFQKQLDKKWGVREGEILSKSLTERIERQFAREGVNPARVVVTIDDAIPNRPTFKQISDRIGLDPIRSISIGGAKLSGVAYDASGKEIGKLDYKWYETDISQVYGYGTWTDAEWTFDRFANRFAKQID
ncbi:MAG: hypothetical protein GC155_12910 [Alphaproteobacteria bacterium]|nr:hypothetical protein [Alphaproteobacteria bacterium]